MNYSGKNNYKDFLEFLHVNYEGIQEYEVFTNDLSVLSYLGEEENQLIFAMINGENVFDEQCRIYGVRVPVGELKAENPEVIDEVKKEQYVLRDNVAQIALWPTADLMITFSQLLGIKGKFFFEPGFARNVVLAKEFAKPINLRFITKRKNNRVFLYGVAGDYYTKEDENLIPDLLTECEKRYGKMSGCEWEMSDQLIKIFCQFRGLPTVSGYELGVFIQTSNVMTSSFRCKFVLKKGSLMIPLDGVVKKHTKKLIGQDIAEELFAKEECFDIARKNLKENYTKDVLKSAKDSKIYNILGKKRLKQIFPSWKGGIERSKDEMIRESERMLESMSLKTYLHERACQLLGYILMNE